MFNFKKGLRTRENFKRIAADNNIKVLDVDEDRDWGCVWWLDMKCKGTSVACPKEEGVKGILDKISSVRKHWSPSDKED